MTTEAPSLGPAVIGKLKPATSIQINSSLTSIGFECLDRYIFDPEKCYDKLAQTGTKWARCQTGWCRCEKEKGIYDFQWLDDVVDNLRRRGIQPWFNVGYGNKLYMPDAYGEAAVGHVPLYYGKDTLEAWCNFIRALARHFKGRVAEWEIWNESDLDHFWQPAKPNPKDYLRLIELTGAIIREEIPGSRIGACLARTTGPFVVELIRGGIAKLIDFYAIHNYRIVPELYFLSEIAALRRLFDENNGKHVRIWTGEAGHASWFPEGHWLHPYVPGSELNQAKWMLRRFVTDMRVGMERSSFFQMVDMTQRPYQMADATNASPARHGILHGNTYEPKLSFHAMSHFNAVFDGDTKICALYASLNIHRTAPETPRHSYLPDIAAVTVGFLRKGWPLYLYYLPEDVQFGYPGTDDVDLNVLDETTRCIENPVLIDLLTGNVHGIPDVNRNARGCTAFKHVPLRDYPLVVTDRDALAGRLELAAK